MRFWEKLPEDSPPLARGTPNDPSAKPIPPMKLLEENIAGKLPDISAGNDFLDLAPEEKATKIKINK